ncbi:TolC family protein [Paludisphaera soli]|uniref:TolC family protein n=1 Tax=Paludisphaera soli TaxID=2712865 RepID=UPI0013EC72C1|nr:TolC family protein [Paludisphaera soli]
MTTQCGGRRKNSWILVLSGLAFLGIQTASIGEARAQGAPAEAAESLPRSLGEATPGSMDSRLGTAPGTDTGPFGIQPGRDQPLMGAGGGTSTPRVPTSISSPDDSPTPRPRALGAPEALPIPRAPLYGSLSLPDEEEAAGPPGGMTIEEAMDRLIQENLDLRSKSLEIPQARADVLTASLRANPIFFADAQMVPYGRYTEQRPGGQTQYDVNISHPVDFSRKRRARTVYADQVLHITEAQYQDAVRLELNNLYTAYVDILSARQINRYAEASSEGFERLIRATQLLYEKDMASRADVSQVRSQQEIAAVGVLDSEENLRRAKRTLGMMLNIPPDQAEMLEFTGSIEDRAPPPPPTEELVQMALACRPDVVSFRLGVRAAEAGLRLAMANRYQDAYVLYQPYTFQDNSPTGTKSAYSWALGLTVPMPIYNRNQGNIERARINIEQSRVELANIERKVQTEVVQAAREYAVTREIVQRIRTEIIPASEQSKNDRFTLFQSGEANVVTYLEAQRVYNDNVKAYLDTAVRHRRSMLNLNTVVGRRLLP